ncbi:MAG: hypothetical protein KDI07_10150 [Anaerolineae bacterium]|nr:hypothetical protein [Anaerolineae bacterium]MCB9130994.1 hypothetical protein [Anaerolineales bacterium]MCB0230744.1 hypothetical protein [Anaerolineae bacterium]MCB0236109.1 hypothetical protein [Anaerolineae bacterium]MCB0238423.1 hypothetical protein [Anaerolineae bacterium]
MSRSVIIWTAGGLIFGLLLGALIGYTVGEGTMFAWMAITAVGGTLFFGLWGYANEQNRNVRHAGDKPKKNKSGA